MSPAADRVAHVMRRLNERRATDAFFISYPKTGTTWLRFLIGSYVETAEGLDSTPLFDAHDRWGRPRQVGRAPRMIFTHRPLLPRGQAAAELTPENVIEPFRGARVAVVVRHPLDALVSGWYDMSNRARAGREYHGSLVSYVEHPEHGLAKFTRFYAIWDEARESGHEVAAARYEDLHARPHETVSSLLHFAGFGSVDDAALEEAIARSSFDRMQAMEVAGSGPRYESGFDIFATRDRSNRDSFHVRRGEVGGYRAEFAPDELQRFEAQVAEWMPEWYGYGRERAGA